MRVVDIAAAAGVSPSTISRVIHGNKNISPETRERVTQTMRQLGYVPTLRKGRKSIHTRDRRALSDTVAVLAIGEFCCLDYLCSAVGLQNLSAALAHRHLQMLFVPVPEESVWLPLFLQAVSGVILLHGEPSHALLKNLEDRPLVSLVSARNHCGDAVLSGHCQIGQMAGNYLAGRGLRNMIAVNALGDNPDKTEQVRGLELFVHQHSHLRFRDLSAPMPSLNMVNAVGTEMLKARLEPLVDQLLAEDIDPAGVFLPSEWMVTLVYRILQERGVCADKRFVFVCSGFSPELLTGLSPRPAFIDIGLQALAEQTVNMLILRMRLQTVEQPFQITIQPTLIHGAS